MHGPGAATTDTARPDVPVTPDALPPHATTTWRVGSPDQAAVAETTPPTVVKWYSADDTPGLARSPAQRLATRTDASPARRGTRAARDAAGRAGGASVVLGAAAAGVVVTALEVGSTGTIGAEEAVVTEVGGGAVAGGASVVGGIGVLVGVVTAVAGAALVGEASGLVVEVLVEVRGARPGAAAMLELVAFAGRRSRCAVVTTRAVATTRPRAIHPARSRPARRARRA